MKIEERRIRAYMKLTARDKLRHLLEYKIFVKKATMKEEKQILIELKHRTDYPHSDRPPSITSSE